MTSNNSTIQQQCRRIFCKILQINPANCPAEQLLNRQQLPEWDSLAHVNLLMALDLYFGSNLTDHTHTIASFTDIVAHIPPQTNRPQKELSTYQPNNVLFIGPCCAIHVFYTIRQLLIQQNTITANKIYYHDSIHLYNKYITTDAQRWRDALPILTAQLQPILAQVDSICFMQIFQLTAPDNNHLITSLKDFLLRQGQEKKFFFMPTPCLPPAMARELQFFHGRDYLEPRNKPLTFFQETLPEWAIIDSQAPLIEFFYHNGPLTFTPHPPNSTNPTTFTLDPFHYLNDFWLYLTAHAIFPALYGQKEPAACPDWQEEIHSFRQQIITQTPPSPPNISPYLATKTLPPSVKQHAIMALWYEYPHLQPAIVNFILSKDGEEIQPILQDNENWLSRQPQHLALSPNDLDKLDKRLTELTNHFTDEAAIGRYYQFIALLLAQPSPANSHPFNTHQAFRATTQTSQRRQTLQAILFDLPLSCVPSPESTTTYQAWQKISELGKWLAKKVGNEKRWLVFGAGGLAEALLWGRKSDCPPPLALISSFAYQIGHNLQGLPILSCQEATRLNPHLIIMGAGQAHEKEMRQLAQQYFPTAKFVTIYDSAPLQPTDHNSSFHEPHHYLTTFSQCLTTTNPFRLSWVNDQKQQPSSYTMADLLAWGQTILQQTESPPQQGDKVAIILPTSPAIYAIMAYCLRTGIIPAIIVYPTNRRSKESYQQQIKTALATMEANTLISDNHIRHLLAPAARHDLQIITVADPSIPPPDPPVDLSPPSPSPNDAIAFIQFSSGTTGQQKAMAINHGMLQQQLAAYGQSLAVNTQDAIASWLPFYHDMGLITSVLGPMYWQTKVVACDPREWVERPEIILEMIDRHQATISWWPNFTFQLLARLAPRIIKKNINLRSLRLLINCSEPITAPAQQEFLQAYSQHGLDAGVISSSYAMAEATFAVTQTPPGRSPTSLLVASQQLKNGHIVQVTEQGTILISSGIPLPISAIKILTDERDELPPDTVGEIAIYSTSLMADYYGKADLHGKIFHDNFYLTGDLGFLHTTASGEVELFVLGRTKDTIIIAGENYFPQDIEQCVGAIPEIKKGRVAAVEIFAKQQQTGQLAIIAEGEKDNLNEEWQQQIKATIQTNLIKHFDLKAAQIIIIPPGTLHKSSSGKIARQANRCFLNRH